MKAHNEPWTGQWVADRLGVALHGDGLHDLLGLALRRNPRRAHLLVSDVLGKHVPQDPRVVYGHGHALGQRVAGLLGDQAAAAVVLGYAETATGLGHAVADGLGAAPYLHSTRRRVPGVAVRGGFEEEHSHATGHLLLPEDPALLAGPGPLVLVDDEFSTGRTVLNTVRDLHARHPRTRYVIVALTDVRDAADRARLAAFGRELGASIEVVALATGTVTLPPDVLDRGRALVAAQEAVRVSAAGAGTGADRAPARRVELGWPAGVPDGGRHGFLPAHRTRLEAALPGMGARIAAALPPGARRVLVLGNEELMYAPLRLAQALQDAGAPESGAARRDGTQDSGHGGGVREVRFSTTTRSPVLAVDAPGYAIRSRIVFPAHDDPTDEPAAAARERYAYNVAGGGFDAVVAVVDSAGDTPALHAPGGLLDRLAAHTPAVLLAVVPSYRPSPPTHPSAAALPDSAWSRRLPVAAPAGTGDATAVLDRVRSRTTPAAARTAPEGRTGGGPLHGPLRGPDFSSYAPDEVGWLLKDLSAVALEAPIEEREEAVQSGGAHYAESLPVEYQPTAAYQALFRDALTASAGRIARAVGAVTELVLAERGHDAVLVSLARAGTPVGVLMRRWARYAHGLDLPHYAVSIVRGRGIDHTALHWIASHHDPADAVFVDGWTGKGAITRELADALKDPGAAPGFVPEIAVLADPGGCVSTFGTRDDFLIPSACLNSTVSGLISRTVLRDDLIGPGDFHGAKFYRELRDADVSGLFLDTVSAAFEAVDADVRTDVAALRARHRAPTWEGWAAVERISEQYGIGNVNLVKPGVGETTRVLLRRVPWRILARRGAGHDLDHVRMLAAQRGVPVEEVGDLPYSCVGLIHPRYTRGATGADGRAVTQA